MKWRITTSHGGIVHCLDLPRTVESTASSLEDVRDDEERSPECHHECVQQIGEGRRSGGAVRPPPGTGWMAEKSPQGSPEAAQSREEGGILLGPLELALRHLYDVHAGGRELQAGERRREKNRRTRVADDGGTEQDDGPESEFPGIQSRDSPRDLREHTAESFPAT